MVRLLENGTSFGIDFFQSLEHSIYIKDFPVQLIENDASVEINIYL